MKSAIVAYEILINEYAMTSYVRKLEDFGKYFSDGPVNLASTDEMLLVIP